MTDYGTIKIPEEAYNKHNEHRKELRMTWEEYIGSKAPEPSDAQIEIDMDEVLGRIDDLEAELPRKVAEEVRR